MLRRLQILATLLVVFTMFGCATTANDTRMVGLVFDPGADTAEITDQITGSESVMYRFQAKHGESIHVSLRPDNQHTEFVLYAPGNWPGEKMYESKAGGSREYRGKLYRDGMHAIQVFQTGDASLGRLTSKYDLVMTKRNNAD